MSISTFKLVNLYKKYIFDFELLWFLDFGHQFISRFKRFTNLIILLLKFISFLYLVMNFVRDYQLFRSKNCNSLDDYT
jgi:hypothetical protein